MFINPNENYFDWRIYHRFAKYFCRVCRKLKVVESKLRVLIAIIIQTDIISRYSPPQVLAHITPRDNVVCLSHVICDSTRFCKCSLSK